MALTKTLQIETVIISPLLAKRLPESVASAMVMLKVTAKPM